MSKEFRLKSVNKLLGKSFFIPHYQRGYRWTQQQVSDLLNDIWTYAINSSKDDFYCLQPVVVKARVSQEDGIEPTWEVIDGQQRLTTIFIILSYLTKEYLKIDSLKDEYGRELFSIRYETRPDSETFLKDIGDDSSNIDYYYISQAYNTVKDWFTGGGFVHDRSDREKFLSTILGKPKDEGGESDRSVQVIWYEPDEHTRNLDLFTRLNIGKIPLTNSELIKALFLSSSSFEDEEPVKAQKNKNEISFLWDEMEQKFSDKDFWAFVTNEKQSEYPNKIELMLDMVACELARDTGLSSCVTAGKSKAERDPLFTFLQFLIYPKEPPNSLWDLWLKIEKYYRTLCEWYRDKNLYHKIGYLIATGRKLHELISESLTIRKDRFEAKIDEQICESISFDIEALSYDSQKDYQRIENILLLFNIETIRNSENISDYYPFQLHKTAGWSLEHIHAQNSEGLDKTKKEPWLTWLQIHIQSMESLKENTIDETAISDLTNLINEAEAMTQDKITWEKFSALSDRIIGQFTEASVDSSADMHSISNLALLGLQDNSALNNSVFEVKRRKIIEMDKEGKYIPICTRRVFLKYYSPDPGGNQPYFWSVQDRKGYLEEIRRVQNTYLPSQAQMEVE